MKTFKRTVLQGSRRARGRGNGVREERDRTYQWRNGEGAGRESPRDSSAIFRSLLLDPRRAVALDGLSIERRTGGSRVERTERRLYREANLLEVTPLRSEEQLRARGRLIKTAQRRACRGFPSKKKKNKKQEKRGKKEVDVPPPARLARERLKSVCPADSVRSSSDEAADERTLATRGYVGEGTRGTREGQLIPTFVVSRSSRGIFSGASSPLFLSLFLSPSALCHTRISNARLVEPLSLCRIECYKKSFPSTASHL